MAKHLGQYDGNHHDVPVAIEINYAPTPTTNRFLRSHAFVRTIVGPIGSGKSSACVVEILRRALQQRRGPDGKRRTRFAVVRNTYRELNDTTRKTFEQWIPSAIGQWDEQDFTFRIRTDDADCEVLFRALDRPEDVKKVLSLELTGAYINELREIPKEVLDGLQGRVGRFPSMAQGGATWFGVWCDTNPWHVGHWGHRLFNQELPEEFELYEQPGGRTPEAENVPNLPPRYYDRLMQGKDSEWVACYIDGKYPSADVGSVFGALLDKLSMRRGIGVFDSQTDAIFTSWDLGLSDATAIWFWRIGANGLPEVLDHYENHGQPLSHYFGVIESKSYRYVKHWLPHDARARTLQTGSSVLDQFIQRYGANRVAIGPQLSLIDGLAAARWLLEQDIRFHKTKCEEGLKALREYRYEWDEEAKCFSKKPLHNWTSHTADAFRYLACVAKHSELMMRKPEPKPKRPAALPADKSFTLDELFQVHEQEAGW